MNTRRIVLRNREINHKSPLNGRFARKRVALKVTENKNILKESKPAEKINKNALKKMNKCEKYNCMLKNVENDENNIDVVNKISSNVTKFILKDENKENIIDYEYLCKNPLYWPLSSELLTAESRQQFLNNIKIRREVIRIHFKHLHNNGDPIWFPDQSKKNEYMHTEYLANINDYMMDCELTNEPLGRDFLENSLEVGPRQRYIYINWIIESLNRFTLGADTLHLSISIVDRFIKAHKANIKMVDLAKIAMMSIFIAAKFEEVSPPSLDDLLKEFDLIAIKDDCRDLEIKFLETLNFELSFPLPISFIRHYNVVIEASPMSHYLSRFFCELSLQDYEATGHSINMMTASCVCMAQIICHNVESNFEQVWNERLQTASGLLASDFMHLVRNLCIIVSKQPTASNYRAISRKYNNGRTMYAYSRALTSTGFRCLLDFFKKEARKRKE